VTEGGYVDAGKLRVEVVADLTGFAAQLKRKVKEASKGVNAKVGVDVSTVGFRGRLRAAVAEAARGVTVKVRAEVDVNAAELRRKVREAAGPQGISVPTHDATDPKAAQQALRATRDLEDAQSKLNLEFLRAENRRDAVAEATGKLLNAERKYGASSEQYRRQLFRVNEAENARLASLQRVSHAISNVEHAGLAAGRDVSVESATSRTQLAALSHPREAPINAEANTKKANAELDYAARNRRSTIKVDVVEKGFDQAKKAIEGLAGPAMASLIAGAGIAITGLVGDLGALIGAIGPVLNNLALIPAFAGGAALSIGAVALGVHGLSATFKAMATKDLPAFNKAMAQLSPEAKKVVGAVSEFRPAFEKVRTVVQETLLKGVGGQIQQLGKVFLTQVNTINTHTTLLQYGLSGAANAINLAFRGVTTVLRSSKTLAEITSGFRQMNLAGAQFARLAAPLTRIVVQLFAAGAPFVVRFAKALGDMTERLSVVVNASYNNGKLTAFFEHGVKVATQLGRIIRDLTVGLIHFFGAGSDSGQGLLDTLEQAMARFRAFTASTAGQAKIKKFFEDCRIIAAGVVFVLGRIIDRLTAWASRIDKLNPQMKSLLAPILLLGGAAAWLASKLSGVMDLLKGIWKVGKFLFAGIFEGASAPALAVVAVIALVAGALYYAWNQSENFRKLISTAFNTVVHVVTSMWDAVKPVLAMFARIFMDTIKPAIDHVIDTLSKKMLPVWGTIRTVFDEKVLPAFKRVMKAIQDVEPTIRRIAQKFAAFITLLSDFADTSAVQTAIKWIGDLLSWVGGQAVSAVHGFAFLAEATLNTFDVMLHALRDWSATATGIFSKVFDLASKLPGAPGFFKDLAKDARDFSAGITDKLDKVTDAMDKANKVIKGTDKSATDFGKNASKKGAPAKKKDTKKKPANSSVDDFLKSIGLGDLFGGSGLDSTIPAVDTSSFTDKKAVAKAKSAAQRAVEAVKSAADLMATSFLTSLTGKDSAIRAVVVRMTNYVQTALGNRSGDLVALLASDNVRLQKLALGRDAITKQLTAAQKNLTALLTQSNTLRDNISKQVRESFSLIATAGAEDITSMTERLQRAVEGAQKFATNVVALKARNLSAALLTQLAEAGPVAGAATAQMLSQASDAQLAELNKLYAQLDSTAKSTGVTVADSLYGAGVRAAQGLVDGLKAKQSEIEAAMKVIATSLQNAIKTALKIKSPSVVMQRIGASTTEGLEVGLLSRLAPLKDAVGQLAGTMTLGSPVMAGTLPKMAIAASAVPVPVAAAATGSSATPTVNVYPRQSQDEREIGIIAARQLEWMRGPAW
jgi:hypothetical protein